MWSLCRVLLGVLVLATPISAFALSCAPPRLDEGAIEGAVAIFEGEVQGKRGLSAREVNLLLQNPIGQLGGVISSLRVYRFQVTRGWKGTSVGQTVEVLYNTYWGDAFVEAGPYLVVSPRQVEGLFWAPLCGNTTDRGSAELNGAIAALERVIGLGHHMKIRLEQRSCQRPGDCTTIQTHCGHCSCGTTVAKAVLPGLTAEFERICAIIRVAESCRLDCPQPKLACQDGHCVNVGE